MLEWTDKDGQPQTLRVRDEMSVKWHDAGVLLGLTPARLQGIGIQRQRDVRQCCGDVLIDWIKDGSPYYPPTWKGLIKLLINLELSSIADTLKLAMFILIF